MIIKAALRRIHLILAVIGTMLILMGGSTDKSWLQVEVSELKTVYNLLPEIIKDEIIHSGPITTGQIVVGNAFQGNIQPIVIRVNDQQQAEHIGLLLIDREGEASPFDLAYDFLERNILLWKLTGKNDLLTQKDTYYISLYLNDEVISAKRDFPVALVNSVTKASPFRLHLDSSIYSATWMIDSLHFLTFKFPCSLHKISAKRKDELEIGFSNQLKSRSNKVYNSPEVPKRERLVEWRDKIYRLPGGTYQTMPGFSSDKYYQLKDSVMPVFTEEFYLESVANFFQNLIPDDSEIDITQSVYGGKEEVFSMKVNSLLSSLSSNHEIFVGFQKNQPDNIKVSIVFLNRYYAYIHLLEVETTQVEFFKNKKNIHGRLTAYIPQIIADS